MSRIGRKPIPIPNGVTVTVDEQTVTVRGPRGDLTQSFSPAMAITVQDGVLTVSRPSDAKEHRALHGLTRSLLANMVTGVTEGFTRTLELVGVGYRAQQAGQKISMTVGYSHPVEVEPLPGVALAVDANIRINVTGIDKQKVGETAARIRAIRPPNVYTGKGIKYQGEQVRRKAGKSAGRGAGRSTR
ncbi:MAG: 50S ribosomal protein L6 [Chloroflexi bacterium]|nr:50S ribosomal protein L6 [Chloroflexota bacterium]